MANSTESNREMKRISKDAPLYIGKVVDNNPKLFSKGQVLKHNDPQRKYLKEAELSVVKYQPSHSAKACKLYRQGIKYKDQPKGDMSLKTWRPRSKRDNDNSQELYVYCASLELPSFVDMGNRSIIKVGVTGNPKKREESLSEGLANYTIEFGKAFIDGTQAEAKLKYVLSRRGYMIPDYPDSNEHFEIELGKVINIIDNLTLPTVVTNEEILADSYRANQVVTTPEKFGLVKLSYI